MEKTLLSLASLETPTLEAMIETMYLAAYADGSVNDAERIELSAHLSLLTQGRLSPDAVQKLIADVERSVREEGTSGRFASIRARLPDVRMREAAIELAYRLIKADGVILDVERALLNEAAEALEVPLSSSGRVQRPRRA